MNKDDAYGYYNLLDVSHNASSEDIIKAYRVKAMELHPDRNPGTDTTQIFQRLNEAYSVLSDTNKRAQYDSLSFSQRSEPQESSKPIEPVLCSSCRIVSAHLRYVIFYSVISLILRSERSVTQGVYCPKCAAKKSATATLITWFLGWWGFPWGLVWTITTLFSNGIGGMKPLDINAKLLAHQAYYFASIGKIALARAVAANALELALKINRRNTLDKSVDPDTLRTSLVSGMNNLLQSLDDNTPLPRLKEKWGIHSPIIAVQSAIAICVISIVGTTIYWNNQSSSPSPINTPDVNTYSVGPASPSPQNQSVASTDQAQPINLIPLPLPQSHLMKRYWSRADNPVLAPLQFETARGNSNFYIKVVDYLSNQPIATCFVRGGEKLLLHIPVGTYRIRYATGSIWYGTKDLFGPETAYSEADDKFDLSIQGDEVQGYTIELYKQLNGNLSVKNISKAEF